MRNLKLSVVVLAVITACLMPVTTFGDGLPPGVVQVWTSVEGNIKYYVEQGEKVKKGEPLFFVETSDNNTAMFFKTQSQLQYQMKLFARRQKLIQTRAVSQEDYDEAYQNLVSAEAELISYLSKVKQGFYVAPFDCEIVELLYLQDSGIGDGNPAINIKCTDPNYKFVAKKPNEKFMKVIELGDKWLAKKSKEFNTQKFEDLVKE